MCTRSSCSHSVRWAAASGKGPRAKSTSPKRRRSTRSISSRQSAAAGLLDGLASAGGEGSRGGARSQGLRDAAALAAAPALDGAAARARCRTRHSMAWMPSDLSTSAFASASFVPDGALRAVSPTSGASSCVSNSSPPYRASAAASTASTASALAAMLLAHWLPTGKKPLAALTAAPPAAPMPRLETWKLRLEEAPPILEAWGLQ